jgi:TolB protein
MILLPIMKRNSLHLVCLVLFAWLASAPITEGQIRISKPAGEKITIQLAGLRAGDDEAARLFTQTLQGDLSRSGWFSVVRAGQAEVSIIGSVERRRDQLHVQCTVTGVGNRQQYLSKSYRHPANDARRLAHTIADEIVEAVTGRKGIASTRIVLVGVQGNAKELFICDADGGNLTQLTHDRNVSVRPRWGPTSKQLTYTAYLQRFPDVFLVDLDSGQRTAVANYSGLNSGGVLSPDGQDMAVVLSKDGNPELYIKNLRSGRLTRLTNTPRANEASPSWSPDGRQIVYVSDQAGRPQLYIISRDGGAPRRVTSRGSENVAPDWGPNGLIAFASRVGGRYQIAIMDPQTEQVRYLDTPDYADYEDPSWAPNGRHIVCARRENYRSSIYVLDTMGDAPLRLTHQSGDWYSPAWSPE